MGFLPDNLLVNIGVLVVAFVLLSKGADYLVNGSVGVAYRLRIPKVIIGIVLVSFGTTTPEFTVSVISALNGHAEIALGNAVGSVIVNVAIALALGVIVSRVVFRIDRAAYRSVGVAFALAAGVTFVLALDGTINRIEGGVLLAGLAAYLSYLVITESRRRKFGAGAESSDHTKGHIPEGSLLKHVLVFAGGLVVVIASSRLLVESAINIAQHFHVSETIIGLTVIAIGTSLPEVATCIVASRGGHGDLAFGDVMGANILNLLWIVGGASVAHPIVVSMREIYFMFPAMLGFVGLMFLLARSGYRLSKASGVLLVSLYVVYAVAAAFLFVPGT